VPDGIPPGGDQPSSAAPGNSLVAEV
jgi:hypothetical protein